MSDPVEAAILLIKERARADAAEARLKRLIEETQRAVNYLDRDRPGTAAICLLTALREARGAATKP